MADKLKKFFKNKKLDTTFKKAGPGHKLNEAASTSTSAGSSKASTPKEPQPSITRSGLTEETTKAAEAALARLEDKKKDSFAISSFTTIQAQVKRELAAEKEKKLQELQFASAKSSQPKAIPATRTTSGSPTETEFESPKILAATGVFFKCPLLGPEILPREEWNKRIREFLYEQLPLDKGLTACLILHSLNKSREKVSACIDIIQKYFINILGNLDEEKYRKIRLSNKIFQEKVLPMEGALLILEAAGFETKTLQHLDGEEEFLVFPEEKLGEAPEIFEVLMDALKNAEPISLELDRNLQVLLPREAKARTHFPDTFYNLTIEEIKRERQLRSEAAEKSQMLRTKAMREKDEMQEKRKYRFGVIRVRFPEEVLLQGTFGVNEKFSTVMEFVRSVLNDEGTQFSLTTPTGQTLTDENATLQELNLVPASVLNFHADSSKKKYLKPDVMALVQTLSSADL